MKGAGSRYKPSLSVREGKIRELEIIINDDLDQIPREIENLDNIFRLNIFIQGGYYGNLFGEEFCLPSLTDLTIFCYSTAIITDSFNYFPNLKYLYIRGLEPFYRPTLSFEKSFTKLTQLEELYLHLVSLKRIPDSVINLIKLKWLSLSNTTLKTLPVSLICNLRSLKVLELKYNDDLEIQEIEIENLQKKIKDFKLKFEKNTDSALLKCHSQI